MVFQSSTETAIYFSLNTRQNINSSSSSMYEKLHDTVLLCALLLAPLSSWITIKITCTKNDALTPTYWIHAVWSSKKVQDFIVHSSYYGFLFSSGVGLRALKCFSCQWTDQTKEAGSTMPVKWDMAGSLRLWFIACNLSNDCTTTQNILFYTLPTSYLWHRCLLCYTSLMKELSSSYRLGMHELCCWRILESFQFVLISNTLTTSHEDLFYIFAHALSITSKMYITAGSVLNRETWVAHFMFITPFLQLLQFFDNNMLLTFPNLYIQQSLWCQITPEIWIIHPYWLFACLFHSISTNNQECITFAAQFVELQWQYWWIMTQ
jgi:hypothetical protein